MNNIEEIAQHTTHRIFTMLSHQPTINERLDAFSRSAEYEKINNASIDVLKRYRQVLEPKGTLDKISYLFDINRAHKYDVTTELLQKKTEVKLNAILTRIENLEKELCSNTFSTIANGFVAPRSKAYYDEFKNQPADELQKQSKLLIARTSAPREGVPTYFCDLAKRLAISKILLEREYKAVQDKYRT